VATPLIANVKGLAVVGSFSVKLIVAVRVPLAVGVNWTVKVVLVPAATDALGCVVILKSPAFVPPSETVPTVKAAVPLLVIVYVSLDELPTAVLLNAVSLVALVVVAPSVIAWLLPVTAICGWVVVATPPTANVKRTLGLDSFS